MIKLIIAFVIAVSAWLLWYDILPNATTQSDNNRIGAVGNGIYCYSTAILNDGQLDGNGMLKRPATIGRQCSTVRPDPTATPFALPIPTDHFKIPAGGM
jgi:hypothetical protein